MDSWPRLHRHSGAGGRSGQTGSIPARGRADSQDVGSNQTSDLTFASAGPTVDPSVIQDLRDLQSPGEPDILQELAGIFAQDTPNRLCSLKDAVARHDAPELRRVAHSLKGSSGNLGARRLAAACARIEDQVRSGAVDPTTEALVAFAIAEFGRVRDQLMALGVKL